MVLGYFIKGIAFRDNLRFAILSNFLLCHIVLNK